MCPKLCFDLARKVGSSNLCLLFWLNQQVCPGFGSAQGANPVTCSIKFALFP
jgi:hypothetical protein